MVFGKYHQLWTTCGPCFSKLLSVLFFRSRKPDEYRLFERGDFSLRKRSPVPKRLSGFLRFVLRVRGTSIKKTTVLLYWICGEMSTVNWHGRVGIYLIFWLEVWSEIWFEICLRVLAKAWSEIWFRVWLVGWGRIREESVGEDVWRLSFSCNMVAVYL